MLNRTTDYSNARGALRPLTDDQIRQRAPSVFALQPHESRSSRYTYIPTANILEGLRGQGFVPVDVMQGRTRVPGKGDYTKHVLKFTHPDLTERARAVGDVVPQIMLKNSHDGSSAYELALALYRLVCSNGLMVSAGDFSFVHVPHKGDVRGRVIEGAFEVIRDAGSLGEHIEGMRATMLTHQEREVFARQAIALRFDVDLEAGEVAPIEPSKALQVRRPDDNGLDVWSTYNVLQENLIKGGQAYLRPGHRVENPETGRSRWVPTKRMHTREVKGIDQNTSLNRALWRLAAEMRAIKAAA